MRRTLVPIIGVLTLGVVTLGACGGSATKATPATPAAPVTAPAAAASPTTSTTGAPALVASHTDTNTDPNTDPKVRAKVLALLNRFNHDHQALTDVVIEMFGPLPANEERIDSGITTACESKATGFKMPDSQIGIITMVLGKAILDSGTDVATYVGQAMDRDRKIAGLVNC